MSYAVRYWVSASPSERQTIILSVPVADPQIYTASGLTPFTSYSFEVAANNSAGTGPFTAPLIVMTDGNRELYNNNYDIMMVNKVYIIFSVCSVSAPNAPVNLASPSQSPTSIALSWEQPAGDFIANYIIVYTYQGGCSNYTQPENMAFENNGSARMYTLQNLQQFSAYAITVQANNTGGTNSSNVLTATTLLDGNIILLLLLCMHIFIVDV